ncbi:MAG: ABC transporter permease [Treponema sp.]|jgi:simple sugar transport system permease protein|nr:ABC transporter permease [Treponema sp.]
METALSVLKSSITIMIPIFFASAGGLFPALAGTLNIALEGLLLAGAFSSLTVFYFTGNAIVSIFCAIFASLLLSALLSLGIKLRSNIFICGLAINLFSGGICIILSDKIFSTKGVVAAAAGTDLLIWYIILGLLLLLISWLVIYRTPFGYRLRACDKNKKALISLGINPVKYQITAILISGFFCGIGGSFLSLNIGAFVPGMSAGKGWIALAVIFLGIKKPFGILIASFIFALAESFSNYAQGFWNIPADFILAIPFVCSLVVMVLVSFVKKG